MEQRKTRITRRALLLGASATAGALVGRYFAPTSDPGPRFPAAEHHPAGGQVVLNDASELSPTPVASHLSITGGEPPAASIERLRAALAEARAAGRPFIASTAR